MDDFLAWEEDRMTSMGSSFLWTSTWSRSPPPPSTCVLLSLTPSSLCGCHKWMAPYNTDCKRKTAHCTQHHQRQRVRTEKQSWCCGQQSYASKNEEQAYSFPKIVTWNWKSNKQVNSSFFLLYIHQDTYTVQYVHNSESRRPTHMAIKPAEFKKL